MEEDKKSNEEINSEIPTEIEMNDIMTEKPEIIQETKESEDFEIETQTAQIPVNEPLETLEKPKIEPEPEIISEEVQIEKTEDSIEPESAKEEIKPEIPESISEPIKTESKPVEPVSEFKTESEQKSKSEPEPKSKSEETKTIPIIKSTRSQARELLIKARNAIQFRKRKKLDKVINMFLTKSKITNDEVEKLFHVSDATATRYLSQLEKEGKIKQNGKTGKSVFYSKI